MHSEKVAYYILDLLQQVPSVYVHGLGRFDAIFHPAVVDVQRSQIKPPYLEPGFAAGEQQAKDILPAYMHYVSGMSEEEAMNAINEFVSRVNQKVNNGQQYSIDKFGTFSRSSSDILHFTPDWDAFNLSFIGLEVLDLHPVKVSTPIFEERHVTETAPEPTPSATSTRPELPAETNWVTDREVPEPERVIEEVTAAAPPPISDSTSRLWWVILASALFLITVLCAYLAWDILSNRDTINQIVAISNDTLANASPDIIIVDTLDVIEEPLPVDTGTSVEVPKDTVEVIPDEPPCFIVVGAFTQSQNVARMEERLQSLGYVSERIKGGSLTRVAIRTSCEKESLQKTLNDARSAINPEAWIY